MTLLALALFAVCGCKKEDTSDNEPKCPDCQNGATCVSGQCKCVGLWSGATCTTQVTPTAISISSIIVTKMPPTDNGAGWDLTSGPDVYVVVKQNGQIIASTETAWKQNATIGVSWNVPFNVLSAKLPITVEVWDYDDFDSNDAMGAIQGTIYNDTNKFPSSIEMDCVNCNVAVLFGGVTYL